MKPKVQRHKKIFAVSLLTTTSILAFLAGYGFQRFIQSHEKLTSTHRRSLAEKTVDKRNFESRDRTPADVANEDLIYHQNGLRRVNASKLRDYLKYFASEPHLAGTPAGLRQAEYVKNEWQKYEFNKVEIKTYDVLLSYPRSPANVTLYDEDQSVLFHAKTVEEPFFEDEKSNYSVYPFNAYSASGDVEAEYVYINYGDVKDYNWLLDHNISVVDKIAIAKYGASFRGEKARLAEMYGILGLLLYNDPADSNDPGVEPYPKSWNMPPGAIPRGNIANVKGDPLTPKYAATDGMFRMKLSDVQHFSKIPVQPISYADARKLLGYMDGENVSPDPDWTGALNITYRVTSKTQRKIRLIVDTPKVIRPIHNVIATITGETEPDRIVMIGNHRDAWVFGGGDPSSGTAVLMETARILGKMIDEGWKPRRTIMLCSWDAEEYGLMGSVEWGQEYLSVLKQRAVVYLNVDIAVTGNYTVRAKASPSVIDKLFEITRQMLNPNYVYDAVDGEGEEKSLFASWRSKLTSSVDPREPNYDDLGSGSDYTFFYSVIGIPSIDMRYLFNQKNHPKRSQYPTYHTIYDNYYHMTTFLDPDFRYHETVTKMWLQYALEMSDDLILRFNLTRYAQKLLREAEMFELSFKELLAPQNVTMDLIINASKALINETVKFHNRLEDVKLPNAQAVRRVNDQMMAFERAFIIQEGILGRTDLKHIIYSPVRTSLYSRKTFPSLVGLLYTIEVEKQDEWDRLREQISVVTATIMNAIKIVAEFGTI